MTEEKEEKDKREEHIHYLEVLKQNSSTFQPEIRFAIGFAIDTLKKTDDVYVKNRKKLLMKQKGLLIKRESINKEVNSIKKELNSLDNMIM